MEENTGTALESLFQDQSEAIDTETAAPVEIEVDKGEPATPPVAQQTESEHVPRAALQDERRKRQEYEREANEHKQRNAELTRQNAEYQQHMQQLYAQQQHASQVQPQQRQGLNPEQFNTYEAYLEAVADAKAEQRVQAALQQYGQQQAEQQKQYVAQQRQQQQHQELVRQTLEDLEPTLTAGRSKYADFDAVVANDSVAISEPMMTIMMGLQGSHDIFYHLGKNPAEASRISRLAPSSQARELGKLAMSVATPPAAVVHSIPKTLTQTRSASGQYTSKPWTGPAPLDDLFKKT